MAKALGVSSEEGVKEIGRILEVPVSKVRRFEGQPREYFDPKEMEELAQSIRVNGQKQPVPVRLVDDGDPDHDYELVDGERRWTACLMAGKSTVEVWVKNVVDRESQFLDSVIYNMARSGHTALEHARAIERIRKSKMMDGLLEGEKIERIAKIFARSTSWVRQQSTLIRLTPEVQAMMSRSLPEEERLGDSIAAFISSAHPDLQREIAETVVRRKLGLNQARLYARQIADRSGGTVGLDKDKRGPRRDYRMLTNYVRKTHEGLSILTDPQVTARILRRDPKELAIVATEIESCIAGLTELRSMLIVPQIGATTVPVVHPSATPSEKVASPKSATRDSPKRAPVALKAPPVRPPLPPPPPPPPPRPRREVQASEGNDEEPTQPKGFVDQQPLELTRFVWIVLFTTMIGERRTANLSKERLVRELRGCKAYNGQPIEQVVYNTIMSAKHRWRKPVSGNDDNQDMARRMHVFCRETGNLPEFEDALDAIVATDISRDPVELPTF